jgi:endonuclease/exonuclease/phosphatase family metal-dependent hydrolase
VTPVPLTDTVADLPLPDPKLLDEAGTGEATRARHDALAAQVPALRLVETRQPAAGAGTPPERLRIAAWNVERCTRVEASAALLRRADISVALLSEMDLGMARSGNRHTTGDLAAALGMGHAYGVEFVELGAGIGREIEQFGDEPNLGALHGNGLVSALPFRDPFMIRLDEGGAWFDLDWHHRRLGGRMAIGATVDLARGPVVLVSVHLENRSTPQERAIAMDRLLAVLPPTVPAVVAGDLNVAALPDLGVDLDRRWFERPDEHEPLFARMRAADFDWSRCNTADQTRRVIPDGRPPPRKKRIDWFFTRGVEARNPMTWAATDEAGQALSDHEMILVDVCDSAIFRTPEQ